MGVAVGAPLYQGGSPGLPGHLAAAWEATVLQVCELTVRVLQPSLPSGRPQIPTSALSSVRPPKPPSVPLSVPSTPRGSTEALCARACLRAPSFPRSGPANSHYPASSLMLKKKMDFVCVQRAQLYGLSSVGQSQLHS